MMQLEEATIAVERLMRLLAESGAWIYVGQQPGGWRVTIDGSADGVPEELALTLVAYFNEIDA